MELMSKPTDTHGEDELRAALIDYRFSCDYAHKDIIERQGEDFNGAEYHEALERATQKMLEVISNQREQARQELLDDLRSFTKQEFDALCARVRSESSFGNSTKHKKENFMDGMEMMLIANQQFIHAKRTSLKEGGKKE